MLRILSLFSLLVAASAPANSHHTQGLSAGFVQYCTASWYGPGFYGNLTANGETYTGRGLTAAHKSLPFGTRVRITDQASGNSIVVRINDRGPYISGRCIDLSPDAKRALGMNDLAAVRLTPV
jgi:rare lipoprotein A